MKKIGIVGHFVGPTTFGMPKTYVQFFSQFGEVVLITPYDQEIRELDLLILPGGPDVNPERYLRPGEDLNLYVGQPCMVRERFDRFLLPQYIEARTPIFGICRGHQTLYVEMGGRLIQDMDHESNNDDRRKLVHDVFVTDGARRLGLGLPLRGFGINSIHHQAVEEESLPANATILARHTPKTGKAQTDGLIEAVSYFPDYPAHTVQWHPEEIGDAFSCQLIWHLLGLSDVEEVEI